jgi:hypothetical protein
MILLGDKKELIIVLSDGKGPKVHHKVACFGRKRHYRKDGMCKHLEGLLAQMRPWHRARTTVTLWGDNPPV